MFTTADWLILAVVVLSGALSLFRGFIKEAVSLIAWVGAFIVTSRFYEPLAAKVTFLQDDMVRKAFACAALFITTIIVVGLCGSLISSLINRVGLSGTDRLLGAVFGVMRGVLIVCVLLALMQIGFKLQILSFVADSPFYRDSLLIPEMQRIVNWFFANGPATPEDFNSVLGA